MMSRAEDHLRYEADDRPPAHISFGLGLQLAILCVNSVVLVPTIVFRAAGAEDFLLWAAFAAVIASGASTILQAVRVGRIGAGYLFLHGSSSTFIAVCVAALVQGGPALLATLIVISAVVQAALSARLSMLRRVLTPIVTGTVIMLLPVTVMPILFRMLNQLPPGAPPMAAPLSACVTIATVVGIVLKGKSALRLWAPVTGIVAGSLVGGLFGIYDFSRVAGAAWVGIPDGRLPGFDLHFGPTFWALLPAFLFVTLVGTTKSIGVAVATQRVSWRRPRAVDFRAVQGAIAAEGAGNLLAGLLGTIPNTPYPTNIPAIEVTGAAARRIGVAAGMFFIVLAFLPKALALVLAIPAAVVAGSIAVVMAMLFVVGMREVVQGGRAGPRVALTSGVSFWVGIAFEFDMIFPDFFADFAGGLLSNGMTTGGLTALLLTALTVPRVSRFKGRLDLAELSRIGEFIRAFAARNGLEASVGRLEAASEEALLTLLEPNEEGSVRGEPRGGEERELLLTARKEDGEAVLEFKVGAGGADDLNLQDRLAWLGEQTEEAGPEQEISLRLLRHLASSVRHQQFYNVDVLTLRVSIA